MTRSSEPSQIDPVVDLWTTDRARFGDESGHGPLYININPSGYFALLAKTTVFGYYNGYYGITGVIPCLGSQKEDVFLPPVLFTSVNYYWSMLFLVRFGLIRFSPVQSDPTRNKSNYFKPIKHQ